MQIAKKIDHTLLRPNTTTQEIINLCKEAIKYDFASVCINPCYVEIAAKLLEESSVKVCTVIGFPLGATTTQAKVFEAEEAIKNGAKEVDMVINIGALKEGNDNAVYKDIRAIVDAMKDKAIVKVILETCLLTDEEKVRACKLCVKAEADFVKTSTGFSKGGATVEDIVLIKKAVGENILIKASGGVRSYKDAIKMIAAGAARIGTSNGVEIISQ